MSEAPRIPWTTHDEMRVRRWHDQGKRAVEIRLFLGEPYRSVRAIEVRMQELGLLRGRDSLPPDPQQLAKIMLANEIALAVAEKPTTPPFKAQPLLWPK